MGMMTETGLPLRVTISSSGVDAFTGKTYQAGEAPSSDDAGANRQGDFFLPDKKADIARRAAT
jgi:hypothetical protein